MGSPRRHISEWYHTEEENWTKRRRGRENEKRKGKEDPPLTEELR